MRRLGVSVCAQMIASVSVAVVPRKQTEVVFARVTAVTHTTSVSRGHRFIKVGQQYLWPFAKQQQRKHFGVQKFILLFWVVFLKKICSGVQKHAKIAYLYWYIFTPRWPRSTGTCHASVLVTTGGGVHSDVWDYVTQNHRDNRHLKHLDRNIKIHSSDPTLPDFTLYIHTHTQLLRREIRSENWMKLAVWHWQLNIIPAFHHRKHKKRPESIHNECKLLQRLFNGLLCVKTLQMCKEHG